MSFRYPVLLAGIALPTRREYILCPLADDPLRAMTRPIHRPSPPKGSLVAGEAGPGPGANQSAPARPDRGHRAGSMSRPARGRTARNAIDLVSIRANRYQHIRRAPHLAAEGPFVLDPAGLEPATKRFRFVSLARLPGLSHRPTFGAWEADAVIKGAGPLR